MAAPLIWGNDFIYAAGLDTKLYKLNSKTGKLAWKDPFIAGDSIREPLFLGKTCVYVFTEGTGLYAVDKQTGKAVWNQPQGRSVLSEQGDQSYVYVRPGVLMQMDNSSGKEKLSVNIAGVDRFAVNTSADSVLYLADKKGRIMAAGQIPKKNIDTAKP
jgi:outer membrane protein assembly factor BamB